MVGDDGKRLGVYAERLEVAFNSTKWILERGCRGRGSAHFPKRGWRRAEIFLDFWVLFSLCFVVVFLGSFLGRFGVSFWGVFWSRWALFLFFVH